MSICSPVGIQEVSMNACRIKGCYLHNPKMVSGNEVISFAGTIFAEQSEGPDPVGEGGAPASPE